MLQQKSRVGLIVLSLVSFASLLAIPFVSAIALEGAPWLTSDTYYVSETALPANQVPYSKGVDCQKATIVDPVTSNAYTDCAVMTAAGPIINQTYTDGVHGFGRVSTIFLPSVGKSQLAYTGSNIIVYENGLERSNFTYSKSSNIEDATYTYIAQNDFAIKHKSSSRAVSIGPTSIAFSNNGKWMVAVAHDGSVGYGIMLFETENYTGRMIAYNTAVNEDTSLGIPNLAVSDDGRYIATGYSYAAIGASKVSGVRVYDTTTCTDVFGIRPTVGRDCSYKNLWTGKVNGSNLFTEVSGGKGVYQQMTGKPFWPLNVRFKDDATITFSSIHDFVSKNDFQASEYTVSLNPPVLAAETINLMALGDSYISGEGAEHAVGSDEVSHYVLGTNTKNNKCHNSDLSYPYLLGAKYAATYHSVACSGAKTGNIYSGNDDKFENQLNPSKPQRSYLSNEIPQILTNLDLGTIEQNKFIESNKPNTILLSIGGNDIGFADIVKHCVTTIGSACYKNRSERRSLLQTIYNKHQVLTATYRTILDSSPGANLYVIGYPQVVNATGSCGANVHLDDAERKFANMLIDNINDTIRNAAESEGVVFIDTSAALEGHRLCDENSDGMNGLTNGDDKFNISFQWYKSNYVLGIGNETYHPTAFGHQLLAVNIGLQTDGLTKKPMTPTKSTKLAIDERDPFISEAINDGGKTRTMYIDQLTRTPVLNKSQTLQIQFSPVKYNVASGAPYDIVFHSEEVQVAKGIFVDDTINLNITTPSIEPGMHELHIYTKDIEGNELDITQTVFIKVSETDFDGDGILNEDDELPFINETKEIITPDSVAKPTEEEVINEPIDSTRLNNTIDSMPILSAAVVDIQPQNEDNLSQMAASNVIKSPNKIIKVYAVSPQDIQQVQDDGQAEPEPKILGISDTQSQTTQNKTIASESKKSQVYKNKSTDSRAWIWLIIVILIAGITTFVLIHRRSQR